MVELLGSDVVSSISMTGIIDQKAVPPWNALKFDELIDICMPLVSERL